jgi:prepilin signal peptidase PulO-like enzyme (type II secretory pathway)
MILARDVIVFLVALCVGTLINWVVYEFSFHSRTMNPWALAPKGFPQRTWLDRLPIFGWLRLRREAREHGHWFWIRPILIELAYAGGMVWLMHFEAAGSLLPKLPLPPLNWPPLFATHAALFALLTAATFIDFDEKIIPDFITIPGAILLLVLTTIWPDAHLPIVFSNGDGTFFHEPILLTTQEAKAWPAVFNGRLGLIFALAIVALWWGSLIQVTMTMRHGFGRAWRYYATSFVRHNFWWKYGLRPTAGGIERGPNGRHTLAALYLIAFVVVAAGVVATWFWGGAHWQSLLTSLAGLGFAGGLVWGVRVGGYIGLRREAMGFGDVTLMTMIGVALGWQASLLVFFLSPFTAVIIALAQFIFTRRQEIAFGPYLALAAVVVVVGWRVIWEDIARNHFVLLGNDVVLLLIVSFLLLMTGMLWIWRLIKQLIFAPHDAA